MLAQVQSSAILGIDAYVVRVEVDISSSLPSFTIVGLPDAQKRDGPARAAARPGSHRRAPAAGPPARLPLR